MISQQEALDRVLSQVSDKVAEAVRAFLAEAGAREFTAAMTKTVLDNEFYRRLNEEMRGGLRDIYREITGAASEGRAGADPSRARMLFRDAAEQIEEIMRSTLEATEKIMAAVEGIQEQRLEARAIIASLGDDGGKGKELARLCELNQSLDASLTGIITDLSFQDLTGQRLKKLAAAVDSIQETVFDLYVSTGLMLKGKEEAPDKDPAQIAQESRRRTAEIRNSELRGPTRGTSQKDVDALLADLGL